VLTVTNLQADVTYLCIGTNRAGESKASSEIAVIDGKYFAFAVQ
jgi:hypothetical protein